MAIGNVNEAMLVEDSEKLLLDSDRLLNHDIRIMGLEGFSAGEQL